eukprot:5773057-Pyramimonas_sp.AAC.1
MHAHLFGTYGHIWFTYQIPRRIASSPTVCPFPRLVTRVIHPRDVFDYQFYGTISYIPPQREETKRIPRKSGALLKVVCVIRIKISLELISVRKPAGAC